MKHITLLSSALLCALALAPNRSSAAWWKGNGWSKNGSLNNDYWEGFGIGYDDWYTAGGHDNINWTDTEAVFEGQENPYAVTLDDDFTCRNVTAFQGYTGGSMTMDLRGHTFSTVHGNWGFFFKGNDNTLVFSNGTVSVSKAFNVGDDNGNRDTAVLADATLAYPEALAIGRGTSTSNAVVVEKGGVVLLSNTDGVHGNWGIVVGQYSGENGNALIVRNGGVVTNDTPSMFIGRNSSGNVLRIEDGGRVYRHNYMHLANVGEVANLELIAPSDNEIIVDGAGSEFFVDSHFLIGESVDPSHKDLGNKVVVSDGGVLLLRNDFQIRSSGNEVVVSNGTIRLNEGGFRLATQAGNGVTGNKLTIAGRSPWIRTSYDFMAVNGATLKFIVPEGGYVAPEGFAEANESFGNTKSEDGGYTYVPVTAGVFFTIGDDTTLEIDARDFAKSIGQKTTIPLIRSCGYGNASGISAALIAAWNQSLPEGCSVSMMGDLYDGWGQKTLLLTVSPNLHTVVVFR